MIRGVIRQLDRSWRVALVGFMRSQKGKHVLRELDILLRQDDDNYYPRRDKVFAAFEKTSFDKVRVVIIGQDPYPRHPDATGLAFSMPMPPPDTPDNEIIVSPSIQRIHCAIKRDLEEEPPKHGNLDHWAKQGVLLLNRSLTFHENSEENNQACKNWRLFIKAVVQVLAKSKRPIQFILWGEKAQETKLPDYPECLIHKAPHPEPRTAYHIKKFRNCQHFSKVNDILVAMGDKPIDWIKDPNQ